MKKYLSLILAVVMCVGCMSFSVTANAQTEKTVTVTLKGNVYGAIIDAAMEEINTGRQNQEMGTIVVDEALSRIAERRAAEIMLFADSENDTRPDNSDVSTLISGFGSTEATIFGTLYTPNSEGLASALDAFKYNYSYIQSFGIGVFGYMGTYSYYVIASVLPAQSTEFGTSRQQSFKVNVALSNFEKSGIQYTSKNKGKYVAISTKFYAGGLYENYVTIPNSQLKYQSSNSKIFKIKDYNGYIKKNGKFTVTSKLKDATVICKDTLNYTGFNSVKPTISKISSPKKKTLKLTWTTNINDAEGYQIQYSTDKSFKKGNKTVIVKGKKSSTKTIAKLKSKKRYYVRVRAYIDQGNGEKAYSNWSKAKNIKVK